MLDGWMYIFIVKFKYWKFIEMERLYGYWNIIWLCVNIEQMDILILQNIENSCENSSQH